MMRPQQPLNSVPVNQNANRMSLGGQKAGAAPAGRKSLAGNAGRQSLAPAASRFEPQNSKKKVFFFFFSLLFSNLFAFQTTLLFNSC
jgi:hypothetical protein